MNTKIHVVLSKTLCETLCTLCPCGKEKNQHNKRAIFFHHRDTEGTEFHRGHLKDMGFYIDTIAGIVDLRSIRTYIKTGLTGSMQSDFAISLRLKEIYPFSCGIYVNPKLFYPLPNQLRQKYFCGNIKLPVKKFSKFECKRFSLI